MNLKSYISGIASAVFNPSAYNDQSRGGSSDAPYGLGRRTKANQTFDPLANSGDEAVIESEPLMENRARRLDLDSPLYKRAVDVLCDLVVGCGINTFADPIDWSFGWNLKARPQNELFQAFDYALECDQKFMDYANEPAMVDVAGKMTLFEMQRLAFRDAVNVGSSLIIRQTRRGPGSSIPLRFQLIEREQIDRTRDTLDNDGPDGSTIRGGFVFDKYDREIGCYVYDEHPHGPYTGGGYKSTFISANRYWHLFKKNRPSQNLGASWMHASAQPLFDRDRFLLNELRSAVKAALFLLVTKTKDGEATGLGFGDTEVPGVRKNSNRELALGTNPIAVNMLNDESIEMIESDRPNRDTGPFISQIDHDFAAASNLSYYSVTGRFNETNYGGFRGAMNLENLQTGNIQNWMGWQFGRPIRKLWNFQAIAMGEITNATAAQASKEKTRYSRFDCIGPGRHLLDADKETKGDVGEMRAGFTTLKIKCARRGEHWLKVLRQIAVENAVADVLGVALDHSAGGGNSSGQNTRSSSDSEEMQEAV